MVQSLRLLHSQQMNPRRQVRSTRTSTFEPIFRVSLNESPANSGNYMKQKINLKNRIGNGVITNINTFCVDDRNGG